MNQIKNWQVLIALTLFIMLLGGYYEQFGLEARTMVLPLGIILIAAFVLTRFKQLEHEVRSFKVMAHTIEIQNFSVIDNNGLERVSISSTTDTAVMTFYDKNHTACAALELLSGQPLLKLVGEKGGALIAFEQDGRPNFTLTDDKDGIIWSALDSVSNKDKEIKNGYGNFPGNGSTGT